MNTDSLKAKLLNISKEQDIAFQEFLNRFGAEQFLARLSRSPYVDQFIFKGGSLLTYLIETKRRTRDLDFSIRQINNGVNDAEVVITKILAIDLDDGLSWEQPQGRALEHPAMDAPGVRMKCPFRLGTAKGLVRIDLAIGDLVEAHKVPLEKIRYKGKPLVGSDFDILMYPAETIFAEKLQIAIARRGTNTRMKDYYDMYKLSMLDTIDDTKLITSIDKTFSKRGAAVQTSLDFDEEIIARLQQYWEAFLRKMSLPDAPLQIVDVVDVINQRLKTLWE